MKANRIWSPKTAREVLDMNIEQAKERLKAWRAAHPVQIPVRGEITLHGDPVISGMAQAPQSADDICRCRHAARDHKNICLVAACPCIHFQTASDD